MTRHANNQNLTLHYDNNYQGLTIQADKGPFILEYLHKLYQTMARSIDQYQRVFAFRFDLRLPEDHYPHNVLNGNEIIDRFIEAFKAKIRHNRELAFRENKYAHDSVVRYVWAREIGQQHGHPHYHFVIFLNYDAFCALGKFEPGRNNIFNRLNESWASALGCSFDTTVGLVEIPENPCYHLHRNNNESIAEFFYRASYLCKSATKYFGNGIHGFGSSRT